MNNHYITRANPGDNFVAPGHVFLPSSPTKLWAVIGEGVVVTIFDVKKKKGGMTHYSRPYREQGKPGTAMYAAPALITLVNMFTQLGSRKEHLEAQIFGGAYNPRHPDHASRIHEENIKVGGEILKKLKVAVTAKDVGGVRGRRLVLNTATGETASLKINKIRNNDWYIGLPKKVT